MDRVAHFLCGAEKPTVPRSTPVKNRMLNTKCCDGPVDTSTCLNNDIYWLTENLFLAPDF